MCVSWQAAFNNNTLGLPKLCPVENINAVDQKMLFTFLKQRFTPNRMVVAGVGVDHGKLVESVQKFVTRTLYDVSCVICYSLETFLWTPLSVVAFAVAFCCVGFRSAIY